MCASGYMNFKKGTVGSICFILLKVLHDNMAEPGNPLAIPLTL